MIKCSEKVLCCHGNYQLLKESFGLTLSLRITSPAE